MAHSRGKDGIQCKLPPLKTEARNAAKRAKGEHDAKSKSQAQGAHQGDDTEDDETRKSRSGDIGSVKRSAGAASTSSSDPVGSAEAPARQPGDDDAMETDQPEQAGMEKVQTEKHETTGSRAGLPEEALDMGADEEDDLPDLTADTLRV